MLRQLLANRIGQLLQTARPRPAKPSPPPSPAKPRSSSADVVLAPNAALVRRIRAAYGYPDDQFEQHLLAPIRALAAWLHFLPGHPGGGFERPGGAIEQALTNCLFSLQAADGRTFDNSDTQVLSLDTTQRWRLACALGGLFASLPQVLTRIEVATEEGRLWPAPAVPLSAWLDSIQTAKYRYRWTDRERLHGPAIYAAARCIDPDIVSFLGGGDARIVAALFCSIAGSDRLEHRSISDVASKVAAAVAARDRPHGTSPPVNLLAGTLKRLLATSDWLPNSPRGHVWFATDGLYLLWPDTASKLLESMRGNAGCTSPDELLLQLVAAGIVHDSPSPLRRVRLPGHGKPQTAVRVADAHRILKEIGLRAVELAQPLGLPDVRELGATDDAGDETGVDSRADQRDIKPCPSTSAIEAQGHLPFEDGRDTALGPAEDRPDLTLDTSKITNPRSRALVDSVVGRLESSFDTMLAKIVPDGIFVALPEFVGPDGDGASIVRALHEAGLLAVHANAQSRRVVSEKIEGASVAGVVMPTEIFRGYREWSARWKDDIQGETEAATQYCSLR